MEKLAIVCCLHGNERYGLNVCESQSLFPFVLANEKALKENKRFIDSDLNRVFPGNKEGNHEEKLAVELIEKIKNFEYILDLHSSSNSCPLFGIITKPNKEKIEFARRLGLKRLVIMTESFASGKSLIDFTKCGISLEVGPHEKKENIEEVKQLLTNFSENKNNNSELKIFEIFSIIKKKYANTSIKNFEEVKTGQILTSQEKNKQLADFDFFPILVGEQAYGETLCLAARKIGAENIYKSDKHEDIMTEKKEEFKVTPWDVSGTMDYERLIKEFGTTAISDKIKKRLEKLHPLLRRGIYYSHRDFDKWLDAFDKKKKVSVITGRGPSEKMHIGHLVPFIVAKSLQEEFGCEVFIPISDDEKFYVKQGLTFEKAIEYSQDNILDIIALGFKPGKTFIFEDFIYTDIYKYAARVAKRITYSTAKSAFGLQPENNIGWSFYPAMQAAHILFPQFNKGKHITVVPVAIDQDPFIRLTRDICEYPEFGFEKPAALHAKFIPSLSGGAKMSSSQGGENALIYLSDSPEEVKKKINKYAFSGGRDTLEEHRKLGGNPDVDVSFQYLRMFFEEDDKKLTQIEKDYRSGKLLSGELKAVLIEKINTFLKEHQKKREEAKKAVDKFLIK